MNKIYYSTKHKYDGTSAEGMTMKKMEHLVVDNEYISVKDDQFGEVTSIHLAVQEPQDLTTKVGSSENEIMTPSDTNKEIISTSAITVL
mgnify:CR=1 FL=1